MYTATLKLETTKLDDHTIDRRFHALSHLHNVMVKQAVKRITRLTHDPEYVNALASYRAFSDKGNSLSPAQKKEKQKLAKQLKAIQKLYGLSEYAFQSYLKVCGRQFRNLLSSSQVQKEASCVWQGAAKCLFSNGEKLHFKKYRDFHSIGGKTNTNGARFDAETLTVRWIGLQLSCKLPKKNSYLAEALDDAKEHLRYCNIKRLAFPNGWHYYVELVIDGEPPMKKRTLGTSRMGIDPGVSTVAAVSETGAFLAVLAPNIDSYEKKIAALQRSMDRSKRDTNPDRYNEDGTVRKGVRGPQRKSHRYRRFEWQLRTMHRKKAAYVRQSHEIMANRLLSDSGEIIVEKMNFKALAKRAKETKRQDTAAPVKQKDGTIREIKKYKRKKRFGSSINKRAPSEFLSVLKRKCEQFGGTYLEINTQKFRASQYNHITDACTVVPLSTRWKTVGGQSVQRDLYSAFLIRNADKTLEHPDRGKCIQQFPAFCRMQRAAINELKNNHISYRACFGF